MKLYAVVMASGRSKRFGRDKLSAVLDGKSVAARSLDAFRTARLSGVCVVTGNPSVMACARERGFAVVENHSPEDDQGQTIRLGLSALPADADGCLLSVCDQPWLRAESVDALCTSFLAAPTGIHALSSGGKRGNPVLFPRALLPELAALPPGETGRYVLARHSALLTLVEVPEQELRDVDTPQDLENRRNP